MCYGASIAVPLFTNYTLSKISSHLLRTSGAMVIKLNNTDDTAIDKLGQWSSCTFFMYIRTQIATYVIGLSSKMTNKVSFVYIE